MKKLTTMLKIATVMAVALFLGGGCDDGVDRAGGTSGDISNYKVEKVVSDTNDNEIQVLFKQTNSFRTGNEAKYEGQDGKTITVQGLKNLTLDPNLCKAAGIRAEEIVNKFAHERHNGSSCFTVFDDLGIKAGYKAENIAAGSSTGAATFTQWKEDGKPYSGQGHRRNMLSESATKIGLAYAYSSEAPYKYYWVMILSN